MVSPRDTGDRWLRENEIYEHSQSGGASESAAARDPERYKEYRRKARHTRERTVGGQLEKARYHENRAWQIELRNALLDGHYDVQAMFGALIDAYPRSTLEDIISSMKDFPSQMEDQPSLEDVIEMHKDDPNG